MLRLGTWSQNVWFSIHIERLEASNQDLRKGNYTTSLSSSGGFLFVPQNQ